MEFQNPKELSYNFSRSGVNKLQATTTDLFLSINFFTVATENVCMAKKD